MKWQGPDLTQKKWGKSATQLDVVLSLKYSPPRSLSLLRFSHCQSSCHVSVTICQSFILCLFSIRVNKKLRLSKQFLRSPAESFYSISSSGLNLFFLFSSSWKILSVDVHSVKEYLQVLTTTWMQAWAWGNNFDSTLYSRKLNTPNRSSYVLIIRRKETDEKSSN